MSFLALLVSSFALTRAFELFAAFSDGDEVPLKHTCNGVNESPVLFWENAPQNTKSFAVDMVDLDSPYVDHVHWIAWGIDSSRSSLEQGERLKSIGITDFKSTGGYRGPCLQTGEKHKFPIHLHTIFLIGGNARFIITLYALSSKAKFEEMSVMTTRDDFLSTSR